MILVSITYCGYTVAVVVSIAGSAIAEQESMFRLTSICFLCFFILKYFVFSCRLSNEQRAAVADYFRVYKVTLHSSFMTLDIVCRSPLEIYLTLNLSQGGENSLKKVSLAGPVLHPFLAYVLIVSLISLFYQHKWQS